MLKGRGYNVTGISGPHDRRSESGELRPVDGEERIPTVSVDDHSICPPWAVPDHAHQPYDTADRAFG